VPAAHERMDQPGGRTTRGTIRKNRLRALLNSTQRTIHAGEQAGIIAAPTERRDPRHGAIGEFLSAGSAVISIASREDNDDEADQDVDL